jgi:cell division protein FtsQ
VRRQRELPRRPAAWPPSWLARARTAAGALAVAGLLGGIAVAWHALDRPVAVVRVSGALDPAQRALVEARVAAHAGSGVLSLDLDALAASLREFDWLRSVAVRRVWPDALHVDARPALPVARWNDDRLLGDDGRLHALVDAAAAGGLPRLTGPDALADEVLGTYVVLSEMAARAGLQVRSAGVDARGEWRLEFAGPIALHLGREDVLERAGRAFALYARELAPRRADVARIDARYADGVAVGWRQGIAAADSHEGRQHGG